MWKSGSGSQNFSSSVSRNLSTMPAAVRTRPSCVIRQPFGFAVVPDVYIRSATSRTRTACRRSSSSSNVTASPQAKKAVRSR